MALGAQLRCNRCKETSKSKPKTRNSTTHHLDLVNSSIEGYCFTTTSAMYWKSWEHWRIPRGILIFFYWCALTQDLFDLLVELRPSSTSAGLEERIQQLHLFEYKRQMLEYLEAVSTYESSNSSNSRTLGLGHYFNHGATGSMTAGSGLQAFSEPDDQLGYDNKSIPNEIITEVFVDFLTRTRQDESALYLKSLSAICSSLDNTFKASNKATLTNKDGQKTREIKGGILTVLNESNEIIAWRLAPLNAEYTALLPT
ncbi:uncharacterized protein F5147DRAFT_769513 [Suillus discolor]|uniref:Uncharacterized protein n=1 Tax=Suillus discolor TaxID=1912936 RepID=A0A9P7FG80_9AGAM|nr:uncharacterized protein F5147DRAFT_770100 [Suillus discolor]XP_041296769.1 uncharacterized protein F5147DRAFT_769513 [Suillus discolor]KAG2114786.1 hypothetical protein F5147DRAFT_770100 [Suillus discolor]KAG2115052.1 hypothetical protein F5147DRAFT_769513 [Suillus discolor]